MSLRFPVVAHGMVSSLGYGAADSCAAARAGILRSGPVPGLEFGSAVTGDPEPATGHMAAHVTAGFAGRARLARLIEAALADLWSRAEPPPQDQPLAVYLAGSDPARHAIHDDLIPTDQIETWNERHADILQMSPEQRSEHAHEEHAKALQLAIDGAWQADLRFLSTNGHVGFAEALDAACRDLSNGSARRALVGSVDSLLEPQTLGWLRATNRLKASDAPAGIMPGEGAGFVLLDSATTDPQQPALTPPQHDRDDVDLVGVDPPSGRGSCKLLSQFDSLDWLLHDQNGEPRRGHDWGMCLYRLAAAGKDLEGVDPWLPHASFGELGTAYGAVATCQALEAFDRGYAPAETALIHAASDGRERTVWTVGRLSDQLSDRER